MEGLIMKISFFRPIYNGEVLLLHFDLRDAVMSKTDKTFERYLVQTEGGNILTIYRRGAEVMPINQIDTDLFAMPTAPFAGWLQSLLFL